MNPALEKQLKLLGQTLASRQNKPVALFELPQKPPQTHSPTVHTDAVRLAEARYAPIRKHGAAMPLQESLESFSGRQMTRLPIKLRPTARRIYGVLHLLGCSVAKERGYHRKTRQVHFFCPAEAVIAHLGLTRGSFYRALKDLVVLGLIDARGHKTTLNGWAVRCDGTLWAVKLFPGRSGKARLTFEDFQGHYRDLEADIAEGSTVWQQVRQSKAVKVNRVDFKWVLTWTLSPLREKNPLQMTVAPLETLELELILALPSEGKSERRNAVDQAAQAVALHLGDLTSLDFYRFLLWQLLRLHAQGRDYVASVYDMIRRVLEDKRESFARRPGALLISRLKACGLWEELREVTPLRVAA